MRRETETDRWEGRWLLSLSMIGKMVWIYLCDRCDELGVWRPNFAGAEKSTGLDKLGIFVAETGIRLLWWLDKELVEERGDSPLVLKWGAVFEYLNRPISEAQTDDPDRRVVPNIVRLENGDWWMPKFIPFHYPWPLRMDNSKARKVIGAMEERGLIFKFETFFPDGVIGRELGHGQLIRRGNYPRLKAVVERAKEFGMNREQAACFFIYWATRRWAGVKDIGAALAEWKSKSASQEESVKADCSEDKVAGRVIQYYVELIKHLDQDREMVEGHREPQLTKSAARRIELYISKIEKIKDGSVDFGDTNDD